MHSIAKAFLSIYLSVCLSVCLSVRCMDCDKTKKNLCPHSYKNKNVGTSYFHFVTITRLTDRDGQKSLGNTVRCITCSRAVKTKERK